MDDRTEPEVTVVDRAEFAASCDGLFVGQLSHAETSIFNAMCRDGSARRSYEGAAGIMGMAKVRIGTAARSS